MDSLAHLLASAKFTDQSVEQVLNMNDINQPLAVLQNPFYTWAGRHIRTAQFPRRENTVDSAYVQSNIPLG